MNKKCARCLKTVYPVEELKCLDKIWHKSCFRCTECGMALTLKNYKGYNRMPYCSAHTPKVQATPIASTPEMKRLTNNTRIQSNIKYHEEYERGKGRCHQTADDTETVRNKQNTKMYSNVAYRICKYENKNIVEQRKRELGKVFRHNTSNSGASNFDEASSSTKRPSLVNLHQAKTRTRKSLPSCASGHSNYSNYTTSSLSSAKITNLAYKSSKFISKLSSSSNSFVSSLGSLDSGNMSKETLPPPRLDAGNTPQNIEEIFLRRALDRNNYSTSSIDTALSEKKVMVHNDLNRGEDTNTASNITITASSVRLIPQTVSKWKKDDSLKDNTNIINSEPLMEFTDPQSVEEIEEPTTSPRNMSEVEQKSSNSNVHIYRAVYNFEAKENDEVSFLEGDRIIEIEPQSSGWLTGRVERTGKIGLVPGNYVECFKDDTQIIDQKVENLVQSVSKENSKETINTIEQ